MKYFRNIRFYVLLLSLTLSILIFFWVKANFIGNNIQITIITQIYALTAIIYLYLALLAGPLNYNFRWIPYRTKFVKARRAIGVSAFYFALLHSSSAFFLQLGGFEGLFYLSDRYLIAISFSFTALLIFLAMAITASDRMVERLTFKRWKMLHRLVYVAAIFIIIHALMLGSHFQDLSNIIPQIFFVAIGFLLILEALRFDYFLNKKFPILPRQGITLVSILIFLVFIFFRYIIPR